MQHQIFLEIAKTIMAHHFLIICQRIKKKFDNISDTAFRKLKREKKDRFVKDAFYFTIRNIMDSVYFFIIFFRYHTRGVETGASPFAMIMFTVCCNHLYHRLPHCHYLKNKKITNKMNK